MFCPNGHEKFVIGPEYTSNRREAVMTCLQCGNRFDAYTQYGVGAPARSAAGARAA
jgi:hypothetical protein